MNDKHINNLSLENPNPVICCAEDGGIIFSNPAAEFLVDVMHLSTFKKLLPNNHPDLLRKCLADHQPLLTESVIDQCVIEWSYQAIPEDSRVNIYGHEVTKYVIYESAYKSTLNDLQTGVIYVDTELQVYFINQSAHNTLAIAPELEIEQGRLSGKTQLLTQKLRQLTEKVAGHNSISNTVEVMSISRGISTVPLEFLIAPIVSQDSLSTSPQPTVVLFLFDRTAPANESTDVLQRLYGLTPSEAKISMLIAQGISLKDVADTLGISIGTARSHLNHVFKKTGSHRQAHLVQQINSGPAWVQHRCVI